MSAASSDPRLARTLASAGRSGDLGLLDAPRRALLISRMPRHPTPGTPWVRATLAAVRRSLAAGETLVTGLGRDPYELALLLCRRERGAAIVVLDHAPSRPSGHGTPAAPGGDAMASPAAGLPAECAELLPARRLLVWPSEDVAAGGGTAAPGCGNSGEGAWGTGVAKAERLRRRDLLIGELADRAWEICVRSGGHMAALAAALRGRGCSVEPLAAEGEKDQRDERDRRDNDDERGAAPARAAEGLVVRAAHTLRSPIGDLQLDQLAATAAKQASGNRQSPIGHCANPRLPAASPRPAAPGLQPSASEWDFLTHYTREPDGPWPGEGRAAYLEWLACGPLDGRREAADALRRILSQGRILGSGRLMPSRTPMVSFTARPPEALADLMRWRRGLRRWTFRPYGIAVRREALAALGARPVRYVSEEELKRLSPAARKFAQKHAPPRADWSDEAEWRLPGDLDLTALPRAAVKILVPTTDEARAFAAEFGYECWAMGA